MNWQRKSKAYTRRIPQLPIDIAAAIFQMSDFFGAIQNETVSFMGAVFVLINKI